MVPRRKTHKKMIEASPRGVQLRLFDLTEPVEEIATQMPVNGRVRRGRGRPVVAPLPRGTGTPPSRQLRRRDAALSLRERRKMLEQWVVRSTRRPTRRDHTRGVLRLLAKEVEMDPLAEGYLQCLVKRKQIGVEVGVSLRAVTRVLRQLREAGLILSERKGESMRYTLCVQTGGR